jgi:hypothetical protein
VVTEARPGRTEQLRPPPRIAVTHRICELSGHVGLETELTLLSTVPRSHHFIKWNSIWHSRWRHHYNITLQHVKQGMHSLQRELYHDIGAARLTTVWEPSLFLPNSENENMTQD